MSKTGPKMQCPMCLTILQSRHRHDFVSCDCKNQAFVDGGSDYLRVGYSAKPPVPYAEPA